VVAVAGAAASKKAPGRPELKVGHTVVLLAAGKLTGSVAVRNTGGPARSNSLAITYRLRGRSFRTRLAKLAVPALGAGKRAVLPLKATYGSHSPGVYVIEACIDVNHTIKESDESDNCKHVALVTVPAGGGPPVQNNPPDPGDVEPADVDGDGLADDTTPPDTIIDSAPGPTASDKPQTVTFHASESGDVFECRVDGGPWAGCTSPHALTALPAGVHLFEVRATDDAGNPDATPAQARWTTIDTTPPTTVIDSGPADQSTAQDVTFFFHATEPSSFACRLEKEGDWVPCSSPFSYHVPVTGPHTLEILATDAAGNIQPSPTTYSWTIPPF
jgi:hypothetical protein